MILLRLMLKLIPAEDYKELFAIVETDFYSNLSMLSPNVLCEFLYLCFEVNQINPYYSNAFFNHISKSLYLLSLSDLQKVNWSNNVLEKSPLIQRKTIEIINQRLEEILKERRMLLQPKEIFPFIYILNVNMPQEVVQKYEKYIEEFCRQFSVSDISIILWSVVEKTLVTKKTILLLYQRYIELVEQLNVRLSRDDDLKMEVEIERQFPLSEVQIIIKSLEYFEFEEIGFIKRCVLIASQKVLTHYLEEMKTGELIDLIQLCFDEAVIEQTSYEKVKSFIDYLFLITEERLPSLTKHEIQIIIFMVTRNKFITTNYPSFIETLFQCKDQRLG